MRHILTRAGIALWLVVVASANAGNIFDDDWTPPTAAKPVSIAPAPATKPVAPKSVLPPAVIPDRTPPVVEPALTPTRLPIPAKPDQARSRKLMAEIFSKELSDRTAAARRSLAEKLMAQADKASDNPTDQFVVLGGAIEAAREGGSLPLCCKAADAMAKRFEVDALAVKTDAALKATIKPDASALTTDNVQTALKLLEQLEAAEDFETGARLAPILQKAAAAANITLRLSVQTRLNEFRKVQQEYQQLAGAIRKLAEDANDPAANLAVGRYHCFAKGDWEAGISLLQKGSDAKLAALAKQESSTPNTATDLVALGDGWRQYAQNQPAVAKARLLDHAAKIYRQALPDLTGLTKIAVEKHIADAQAATNAFASKRTVDLLTMIDLDKDVVRGDWRREKGALTWGSGDGHVEVPYDPPAEYDLRISYTRLSGDASVDLILTHAGHDFAFCMDPREGGRCGFEQIDGKSYFDQTNPTTAKPPKSFQIDQKCNVLIQVRSGSIKAIIDDKVIADYDTDYTKFALWDGRHLNHRGHLGFGGYGSIAIYHSVELIEISGEGKFKRE